MKAQLLEDIGKSQPLPPPPGPGARAAEPQPQWPHAKVQQESRHGNGDTDASDWFERWGSKVASWFAVLAAALLLAGAGTWLYNENKLDTTLKVLANAPIPAQHAKPVPAPAYSAAAEVTVPATAPSTAQTLLPTADAVQSEAANILAAPTKKAAPLAGKKATETQVKYVDTKPARPDRLAETLKQCREAGYHAARCLQLGCKATKYGLACKGSSSSD